jgi:antitoxin (DNA-binding transcriptional repressor) of toxin-antitoxin stability system
MINSMSTNTFSITVTEAVRNFSDFINRVTYRHETFVLHKGNKPVAELCPLPSGRRLGDLPAILRSLPRLTSEDAAAFETDLCTARMALPEPETKDPWAS